MRDIEADMARSLNLHRIDVKVGEKIDYNTMEASEAIEGHPDKYEQIAEEMAPGYKIKDRRFYSKDSFPEGMPVVNAQVSVYAK